MDVSLRLNRFFLFYAYLVFSIFIISTFVELPAMWGINHLSYIGASTKYIFLLPFIISIIITFVVRESLFENLFENNLYYSIFHNQIHFSVLMTILVAFFYLFKLNTYFLGDGYTWIAHYSNPDFLLVKPTELLSSYIVKGVQLIFGVETKETSSLAFQIVSVFSGAVFLLNLRNSLNLLISDKRLKVFAFLSFVTSGSVLLFMGYIEFYPMLWMATSFYLYYSIKSLTSPRYLLFAVLLFFLLLLIHAQSVYLSLGFLYLIAWRGTNLPKLKRTFKKYWAILSAVLVAISLLVLYLAYNNFKIAQILLPIFYSKPDNPGYAVFSVSHLLDIANLVLLLFPVLVVSFLIFIAYFRRIDIREKGIFFLLSSIGSLLFLLLVEPYIGFARDWDLMSMTLLFPMLFSFYIFEEIQFKFSGKSIFILLALSLSITSSYLYINVREDTSIERYESILKSKEGLQFRPGWTILNNYYIDNDLTDKSKDLQTEMRERFSEYSELDQAYRLMDAKNYPAAYTISTKLIDRYPNNIDFVQLRASLYIQLKRHDSAQYYLEKALSIQSTYPPVLLLYGDYYISKGQLTDAIEKLEEAHLVSNGKPETIEPLAFCYINTGQLQKAGELAKKLYQFENQRQTYHLISMMIFLKNNNNSKAVHHYKQFISMENTRSDFQEIKQSYAYLLSENN